MDAKSASAMQALIKGYYEKSYSSIAPTHVSEREFGFGDFENKISYRHTAFKDLDALHTYLRNTAPAYVLFISVL